MSEILDIYGSANGPYRARKACVGEAPVNGERTIILDQDDIIISWGSEVSLYLGRSAEHVLGKPITEVFPPSAFSLPDDKQITAHVARFGGYDRVHAVQHRDGDVSLARVSAIVQQLSSGRVLRHVSLQRLEGLEQLGAEPEEHVSSPENQKNQTSAKARGE